ncbi:hypothetical protein SK069_17365 [Patulibacter brassicae]|uniref:Uncharacterized protein n=1 Tax=Patulibacter brassicae TaxID=1705717 RepID=A0ABU4VNE3_9ACTN|nr:hypothetical protein [Patulibacter brassicae]MDX8153371.1 hypothetical protein [Patulibacter brassicae]
MSPEQRLTVRQAVDLIAQRGSAPISEAALRARIRARRVGVVRIGGRVYTNPLNLVTAGLLPVEALDGVSRVPRAEIDDAELHAWLNPDEEPRRARPSSELEATEGASAADGLEPTDSSASGGPSDHAATAGPLERTLRDASSSPADEEPEAPEAGDAIDFRPARPSASHAGRGPHRALRAGVLVAIAVATIVLGTLAFQGVGDRSGAVAEVRGASLVGVERELERSLVSASARAGARGDYDAALELAAAAGDERGVDRWRSAGAGVVLSRARRAVRDGHLRSARRHLQRARSRYGDPLPDRRRSVIASVTQAERAERPRAAQRRASEQRVTPVVASSSAGSGVATTGAGTSSSSPGGAGATGTSSGSAGSGRGGSGSRPAKGPGEFF